MPSKAVLIVAAAIAAAIGVPIGRSQAKKVRRARNMRQTKVANNTIGNDLGDFQA